MHMQNALVALVAASAVTEASIIRSKLPFSTRSLHRRQFGGFGGNGGFGNGGFGNGGFGGNFGGGDNNGDNNGDNGGDNGGDDNADNGGDNGGDAAAGNGQLDPNVIQQGSQSDGNPTDGQSASATDDFNFINFCQGEDLTNGEQKEGGSCNGIPMGKIPGTGNMVSAIFVNPQNGDDIQADTDFNIDLQVINFAPGTFTNPDNTYYAAPQDLDGNGNIIGHTHVTVQDLGGDPNPTQPLDPTQFTFFKGINDAGNGNGLLSAAVEGGLPAGTYRVCSLMAAANHQPVIMPVAQRGAQDDCVRFTVGAGNGGGDDGNNGGDDGNNDGNNGGDDGNNGGDNGFGGGNNFGGDNGFGGGNNAGFGGFGGFK